MALKKKLATTASVTARYVTRLHEKQALLCASGVFRPYVRTAASVFQARFAMILDLGKEPYGTEKC